MIYLNLLYITVITVIIIDISGFIPNIEQYIAKWLKVKNVHMHLIECSFCINWWLSLLYIIFTNNFTLSNIAYILFLSTLTPVIYSIIITIREKLIEWLSKLQ